jgi:broad specificity phosphatase PhoE
VDLTRESLRARVDAHLNVAPVLADIKAKCEAAADLGRTMAVVEFVAPAIGGEKFIDRVRAGLRKTDLVFDISSRGRVVSGNNTLMTVTLRWD